MTDTSSTPAAIDRGDHLRGRITTLLERAVDRLETADTSTDPNDFAIAAAGVADLATALGRLDGACPLGPAAQQPLPRAMDPEDVANVRPVRVEGTLDASFLCEHGYAVGHGHRCPKCTAITEAFRYAGALAA